MTLELFRRMAYAAELAGKSRCAWVAAAILEKIARDGVPAPPEGWEPSKGHGRPTAQQIREHDEAQRAAHFSF
jgi:hypothetical protein